MKHWKNYQKLNTNANTIKEMTNATTDLEESLRKRLPT